MSEESGYRDASGPAADPASPRAPDAPGSFIPGLLPGPADGPDQAYVAYHPYPADLDAGSGQQPEPGQQADAGSGPLAAGPLAAGPLAAGPPAAARLAAGGLSGRGLVAVTLAVALAAALIGGLAGGFIVSRSSGNSTEPGFSLGTVSPAQTNRPPASVAGVVARVLPSVVMITVNRGEGTGSGFVINGGYIVTDNHVVTLDGQVSHASLQVVINGGRQLNAKLVGRDPFSDIAVIKPENGAGLPALALGNSDSVAVGDPVIAIGSPLGLAGTVTSGIVSALDRPVQPGGPGRAQQVFYDAIQTDAPINPGNSGGPLVNGQGQVIGVDAAIDTLGSDPLTGSQGGSIGLGFAIPINQVRIVATELIRTGHAAHAVIGALINVDYRGTGAQIVTSRAPAAHAITPGGPADLAGLRPGDIITSFGGQLISSSDALLDAIRSRQPGTRVLVRFTRHGKTRTVTVTLGSATS